MDNRTEAVKAYRLALRLKPDLAIAYYHLGNLLTDQGKTKTVLEHYRAFVRHWKDDPRVLQMVREKIRELDHSA